MQNVANKYEHTCPLCDNENLIYCCASNEHIIYHCAECNEHVSFKLETSHTFTDFYQLWRAMSYVKIELYNAHVVIDTITNFTAQYGHVDFNDNDIYMITKRLDLIVSTAQKLID